MQLEQKHIQCFYPKLDKNFILDDVSLDNWKNNFDLELENYITEYKKYFNKNNLRFGGIKKQLDPIPKLLLFPGIGTIGIGTTKKAAADSCRYWGIMD